jgi:hypothetical protein
MVMEVKPREGLLNLEALRESQEPSPKSRHSNRVSDLDSWLASVADFGLRYAHAHQH